MSTVRGLLLALALAPLSLRLVACANPPPRVPASCFDGAAAVARALAGAPGHVALRDGTLLSTCIERSANASSGVEAIAAAYVDVAQRLASTLLTSQAAAVQLGYLVGATERGAAHTNGVQAQLVERMGNLFGTAGAPAQRGADLERGRAAGMKAG
jgi:hypothetical protein